MASKLLDSIREHNMSLLAEQIKQAGGSATPDVESIVSNVRYLAVEGEKYGEKVKYLPLQIRRLIASLDEDGTIVFRKEGEPVFRTAPDGQGVSCSVGGYLVEQRPDGTEVRLSGYSCGGASVDDVYPFEQMSDAKRRSILLSVASARAESNAFYNAGFFAEYKGGDVFDLDSLEAKIPAAVLAPEAMPDPQAAKGRGRKKAKAAEVETPVKPEPAPTPVPAPAPVAVPDPVTVPNGVPEEVPFDPVADAPAPKPEKAEEAVPAPVPETAPADAPLTYEEALKAVMDEGSYEGQTLGEILQDPRKARNLTWAKKNPPEKGRAPEFDAALDVVIEGYKDGALKRFL